MCSSCNSSVYVSSTLSNLVPNCSSCTSPCLSIPNACCGTPCVTPCVYDCSPPLWATWPCIDIRTCVSPCVGNPYYNNSAFCGC